MNTENITFDSDKAMAINGVNGRLTHRTRKPGQSPGLWFRQRWVSVARPIKGYGCAALMTVNVRFDDGCGNGHNSFSITGNVVKARAARGEIACGCLHDDIARVFPELAHLIKWHLTAASGPIHYVENTCYHTSDRDHNGLLKGESRQIKNGKTGLPAWELVAIVDGEQIPLYTLQKYIDSDTVPGTPGALAYVPWCHVGEGKERDFSAARSCAVWPDATDEQLSAPRVELEAALLARLPGLLVEFRADVTACGFLWSPEEYKAGEL